jgi:hypothetical protein
MQESGVWILGTVSPPFGVTSTLGDHLLRTAPDQSTVKKSGTARTLGAGTAVGE